MKNAKKLFIQRQWCKGCRVCVVLCPKEVLDIDADGKVYPKNLENCIYCGLCELRCPDLAIEVREERSEDAGNSGHAPAEDRA
ncbi:MAG: ferredoxin family protein [Deltaproteobacteria bacterium]|jgi:2-oxoglutarate ferredoxin oxidoreductase subunit delta|nr:ferredoxin family protein [Deltaproteobacteria bacterium]